MSRVELHRIVTKDDKGIGEANGTLAQLYRRILYDLGVDAVTLEQQLNRWVRDPHSHVEKTVKKITQARGNYIKKMIEPSMTWKSFADLVMMLYPNYIRLTVDLGWDGVDENGKPRETSHSLWMDTSYLNNTSSPIDEEAIKKIGLMIKNYSSQLEMDGEDEEPYDNDQQLDLFDSDEDDVDDY